MSILNVGITKACKGISLLKKSVLNTRSQNIFDINTNTLKYIKNPSEDVFALKNTATKINLQLKNIYGIESEISNPEISKRVLSVVEDYCSVNKKNNLFTGTKLKQDFYDNVNNPSVTSWDYATKDISVTFNENFKWRELKEISQELYDKCEIPTNIPNFYIFRDLANVLNFKYNPYAFHYSNSRSFVNSSKIDAYRLLGTPNIQKFNSTYIAAKMNGQNLPKKLRTFFSENGGNMDLKFPKPVQNKIIQGSIHHFRKQEDAINYLKNNYGIEANFISTEQANLFSGAVDDLSKIIGTKECFRGLKISVDPSKFESPQVQMGLHWDSKTGHSQIYINPAYDWKHAKKNALNDFESLHHPTTNPKGTYIHELVHYLDFNGNPSRYADLETAFSTGRRYYNEIGEKITAKVSSYASTSPAEFKAEYVCGRINGIKYPKMVDNAFKADWNGPALNFVD